MVIRSKKRNKKQGRRLKEHKVYGQASKYYRTWCGMEVAKQQWSEHKHVERPACKLCRAALSVGARPQKFNRPSPILVEESDQLKRMKYNEYLKTQHWQRRRISALKKANNSCQICNSNERLDVHHRTYERRGCERPTDLTVLCRQCHTLFHTHKKIA